MSAKSKRRRVRKTVKHQSAAQKTWAQRARASTWVFVLEFAAIAVTVVGFGAAVYGLWEQIRINGLTVDEIQQSRETREQEALARNWALLTTRASGNSGKGQALEYLASKGVVLDGIDLSCKTMGGMEMDEKGKETCERPTYLYGVELSKNTHGTLVSLNRSNLSGANLFEASLSDVHFSHVNLSGADLWQANLSGALLGKADLIKADLHRVDLNGAYLSGANLSEANLSGADLRKTDLFETNFSGANLSGTDFTGSRNIETAIFNGAWAWSDQAPIELEADIDLCVLFDFALERPDPCVPPEE